MWLHQHHTPLPFDHTESKDWTLNAHWAFPLMYCVWLCWKEIWEVKELNIRKVSVQQCWACSRFPADKKTPLYRCDTLCAIERNGCLYRCWHCAQCVCFYPVYIVQEAISHWGFFFSPKSAYLCNHQSYLSFLKGRMWLNDPVALRQLLKTFVLW